MGGGSAAAGLTGAAATFVCRNTQRHPGGDHVVFLGEVERVQCETQRRNPRVRAEDTATIDRPTMSVIRSPVRSTSQPAGRAPTRRMRANALITELMRFPEVVQVSAAQRSPQIMAGYLRELAADLHAFYNAQPVLSAEEELRNARLGLAAATRQVLANGLGLLGVSAPESM